MKTYLEIQVPLRFNAVWLESLRAKLDSFPIRWQQGFYHITMAFIDDTPEEVDMKHILDRHFGQLSAIELTFDKLDVFTAGSESQIIYLTSTQVPQSFLSLTESIRSEMTSAGCKLQSGFRLHVTLGRVKSPDINQEIIRERLNKVPMPKFTLSLTDVDYRVYRGETLYEIKLPGIRN